MIGALMQIVFLIGRLIGELLGALVVLTIQYPRIMIPLIVFGLIVGWLTGMFGPRAG
jgi:hypothetical protein